MKQFEEKRIADIDEVHEQEKASEMTRLNNRERRDGEPNKSNITNPCLRGEKRVNKQIVTSEL